MNPGVLESEDLEMLCKAAESRNPCPMEFRDT